MTTTAIFAEILIIGLQASVWLALFVIWSFRVEVGRIDLSPLKDWSALITVFVVASAYTLGVAIDRLSDGLDGYLARKYDWESAFGKMFDPVADKLLVLGVAVSLVYTGHLPMLLMCLMLVKDFVVIFGAFIYTLLAGFPEVKPLMIGKVTTALQIILITCLLITAALQPVIAPWVMPALFWMVALTTFVDGIIYLWVWTGKLRFDERYY